jgi:hypothetical protein
VPPSLAQLVLRFDQPVDSIAQMVGDHGSNVPLFTAITFDYTRTVLTLRMKLRAGQDYIVPLGAGAFVSRAGYPLRDFLLRFRTAAR